MAKHKIRVTVNGSPHEAEVESRLLLVHFLREVLRLEGRLSPEVRNVEVMA